MPRCCKSTRVCDRIAAVHVQSSMLTAIAQLLSVFACFVLKSLGFPHTTAGPTGVNFLLLSAGICQCIATAYRAPLRACSSRSCAIATSGTSSRAGPVFQSLHEGWDTVMEANTYTYNSNGYVAFKSLRFSGKHSWCVAVENTASENRGGGSYYSTSSQPQPLVSGVASLHTSCSLGDSLSPHTLCSVPTTNSAGTVSSSDNERYCTVLRLRCQIEASANTAPADTGLPFPCALLLLFHLDADQGRMWVAACMPGRENKGNLEVFHTSEGRLQGVCPAVQPVPHARLHVMLFDY